MLLERKTMLTLHLLQQAAALLAKKDQASVPMIERSLGIDSVTANDILDSLIQLGVLEEEDVYRVIEISEETKVKIQTFLTEQQLDKRPDAQDELFYQAVQLLLTKDHISASVIQRMLNTGYARSARLLEQLETAGLIAPSDGSAKPRKVVKEKVTEYLEKQKNS